MEFVKLEVKDSIGIVTFNRPPINALNLQAYDEIKKTFQTINEDVSIKAVILTSEGKTFMAGNDVNDISELTSETYASYSKRLKSSVNTVYECRVPVIAALNGATVGSGLSIASSCDVIIASENVKVSIPEINVGIVGAAEALSRVLPHKLVRYLGLTGKFVSASEIKHHGGFLDVVPADELMDKALGVAKNIASKSPLGIENWKAYLNKIELVNLTAGDSNLRSQILLNHSDSSEAAKAFLEKRKPNFQR